ncbi:MAG: aldo/keto reductase [Nitrospira sp.]|nr:aldo/keto reductase [Nitrospira sp.]
MRLALGTAQFGLPYGIANQAGQVTRPAARAMLDIAAANGIDTLDTAIAYGESETCLGEVGVQGFKLVTKLPAIPAGCDGIRGWVQAQVNASLARLGVKAVYGLLLHRPDQLLDAGGAAIYQALQSLKEAGLVQKVGVSVYAPSELEALIPRYRFDLIQAPFNLVDRRVQSTGWLRRLKDEGIEVHTRSVFLQGLLLMSQTVRPEKFSPWSELWNTWDEWLSRYRVSAVQACLAFPLSVSESDRVVVGADSVSQLEQIVSAAASAASIDFPDLSCNEETLINPARWCQL